MIQADLVNCYRRSGEEYLRRSQSDPATWYAICRHRSGGRLLGRNSVETGIFSQPKRKVVISS